MTIVATDRRTGRTLARLPDVETFVAWRRRHRGIDLHVTELVAVKGDSPNADQGAGLSDTTNTRRTTATG